MRWKIPAGFVLALALLIPAAPALAATGSPTAAPVTCQPVVHTDIRKLVTIDLTTASDTQVRVLANQILSVAKTESLSRLPGSVQARLDGTAADLRVYLQTTVFSVWSTDLRIATVRMINSPGSHVKTAAQQALDT